MPAVEKTLALDIDTHTEFEPVTPSNVNELAGFTRKLFIGGAGNLYVQKLDGTNVFLQGLPAGAELRIRVKMVLVDDGNATTPGSVTTATNIIALY